MSDFPTFKQWLHLPSILTKKEKIFLVALLFITIASLWTALFLFEQANTVEMPAYGGTHTEGILGGPSSLNPIYASNSDVDRQITELIFSGLYKYDENGKIVPDIAQSLPEVKENGTVYEVVLKDNVYFHDDVKLSSEDILYTIQVMQDADYKSPLRVNWIGVVAQKIGDNGIRFRLKNAYPDFLERLTFKIIPQHIWGQIAPGQFPFSPYNFMPVGSGPYVLKDVKDNIKQDNNGHFTSIKLTANPRYYDRKPYVKNVIFKFFEKESDMIQAAREQRITGFLSHSNQDFSNRTFAQYSFTLPRYFAVFFNLQTEGILAKKEIRQALNLATDKQQLIAQALNGRAVPVDSPILPDIYGFQTPSTTYAFDASKAKEILLKNGLTENDGKLYIVEKKDGFRFKSNLKQGSMGEEVKQLQKCLAAQNTDSEKIYPEEKISGIYDTATKNAVNRFQEKYRSELLAPDKIDKPTGVVRGRTRDKLNELCIPKPQGDQPFKITLTTVTDEVLEKVANNLKDQWQKIGIEVEVKTYSLADLKQQVLMPRDYQALIFGEVLSSIPDPFPFWHSSQGEDPGLNLCSYKNDEVDRLLEKARQDIDPLTRQEKYEQMQNLIIGDAPAIFLYNPQNIYFASKDVKGIKSGAIVDLPKIFSSFTNWYIKTGRSWKR